MVNVPHYKPTGEMLEENRALCDAIIAAEGRLRP
jgi:hypothetical protein